MKRFMASGKKNGNTSNSQNKEVPVRSPRYAGYKNTKRG